MKTLAIIGTLFLVTGCDTINLIDMHQSKNEYKNCLLANPKSINSCDNLKLAYEADIKGLQQTTRALRWGTDDTITINHNQ